MDSFLDESCIIIALLVEPSQSLLTSHVQLDLIKSSFFQGLEVAQHFCHSIQLSFQLLNLAAVFSVRSILILQQAYHEFEHVFIILAKLIDILVIIISTV